MRKSLSPIPLLVILSMLLGACNLPAQNSTPGSQGNLVQTAAAQTVMAMETEIAQPATVTPPGPVTVSTATQSPPTATVPTATGTQPALTTATPLAPTATSIPCDRAGFVKDVTIPDDTVEAPNASFTKTWRLKNTGSCTWTTSYSVVFDSGNAMNGPASFNLPSAVAPGQEIDISVTLKAPSENNTYQGYWKLQNANGVKFGLGSSAKNSFWVKIVVATTQVPFAITSANITVDNASASGCPHTFKFTVSMTASAAGHVTYYWEIPSVGKSAVMSTDFDSASTKSLSYQWELPSAGSYSIKLYNDIPNHQYFNGPSFTLACP